MSANTKPYMSTRPLLAALAACAALAVLAVAPSPAGAATFTVDSFADASDADPGDGTCASASGQCTLRAAVMEANANSETSNTISLPAGTYDLTLPGIEHDGGALFVSWGGVANKQLTIIGQGWWQNTVIRQNVEARVIRVSSGSLRLHGLQITGGGPSASDRGGDGGGIHSQASLELHNVLVHGNAAQGDGGGIYMSSSATGSPPRRLSIEASTIAVNTAAERGGGLRLIGNGSDNEIVNSRLIANTAANDGGASIGVHGGDTLLDQVEARGNRSTVDIPGAGGIRLDDASGNADVTLRRSLVTGNVGGRGGVSATSLNGSVQIENSTISGNLTNEGHNGVGGMLAGRNVAITHSTITNNGADGAPARTDALEVFSTDPAEVTGSIVDGDCNAFPDSGGATFPDSGGANVFSDASCGSAGAGVAGDDVVAPPQIAPLADNGGGTRSHLPTSGSPAVDRVDPCLGAPFDVDQRSVNRTAGGTGSACDSGAVERGGTASAPTPPPPSGDPPVNVGPPQIQGTPHVGLPLHCTNGSWTFQIFDFDRQWLRGGTPIPGATNQQYTPVAADVGPELRCFVRGSNAFGFDEATSAPVNVTHPPDPGENGGDGGANGGGGGANGGNGGGPGTAGPDAGLGLPARLQIARAQPRKGNLRIGGRLAGAAAGERLVVRFRARGREIRFRPRVRDNGRIQVNRRLRGPQRRARAGRLSVRFHGNDQLRPARTQLRVARRPAGLRIRNARLSGSRLVVAGRVARQARGRVLVSVEFNAAGGGPRAVTARPKVNRRGVWRLRRGAPPAVRANGAFVTVRHAGRAGRHGQQHGRAIRP